MSDEQQVAERAAYIAKWGTHMDAYFAGAVPIAGQRLLVIGSGWGSEVLWALRNGARAVVGLDPGGDDRRPLERALADAGEAHLADRFELRRGTAMDAGEIGPFNHVISNNVFEHVEALSANLAALALFVPASGSRIRIFCDPLFYSAFGHHLPIGPWEHLTLSQADVRAKVGPFQWRHYREGLNGMTVTDFLAAVREAGLILLDFSIRPEGRLAEFGAKRPTLPPGLKPMDLCLSGLACTLAFPHNL